MPKRKRGAFEGGGDRAQSRQKRDVEERLTEGKKSLQRALKVAKGFERQRLGKRLTNARTQGKDAEIERINKEIEILKGLDMAKVGEAHLRKTILKVKAFAESEILPEAVKAEPEKPDMAEEDLKAWNNVLSGMFNMKPIREAMSHIMSGMYTAFGVSPSNGKQVGAEKKVLEKKTSKDSTNSADSIKEANDLSDSSGKNMEDATWEGFGPEDDDEGSDLEAEDDAMGSDEDLDEEELARYDALLGGSSDEESFDEEEYKLNHPSKNTAERLSLSLSPTLSVQSESDPDPELGSESESESESEAAAPPPKKVAKPAKTKTAPAKVGGSTFLPTLMGGYYEGSDSSASDIEEEVVKKPAKKNRPGQMARQAIWEKKYGKAANHMKKGLGPVAERKSKDDGWDAKRGARDGGDRRGRGGGSNRGRGAAAAARGTGENSTALGERKKGGAEKKDDAGVLHPSWQAAKKAKEMTKTASFQGKKVVFD